MSKKFTRCVNRETKFTFVVLVALLPCSCSRTSPETAKSEVREVPNTSGPVIPPDAEADQLPVLGELKPFQLTDQFGRPCGDREFHGNICILQFFFTSCTATCPRQMKVLSELSGRLDDEPFWKIFRFVSVTVDPATDTPESLRAYAQHWSAADDPHWIYLTGEESAIRHLCSEQLHLPVIDQPSSPGSPIAHTTKLVLLDPIGRIRGYYDALDTADVAKLVRAAESVWSEQVPFLPEVIETPWMSVRQRSQLEMADRIQAKHDFQFTDRQQESGIRFIHRVVDDCGRDYKGVHYDHGNGMTIADVDGDGLTDIYFTTQLGRNELWRNIGNGRFEDVTARAGVAVDDRVCVSASFVDIDNDSDSDLYVTAVRKGNLLFRNNGKGLFEDITDESGLGYQGHSSGALFFDYDRDGLLDLFLCNVGKYTTDVQGRGGYYVGFKDAFSGHLKPERTEFSRLYRNVDGLHFRDVTEEIGMAEGSWTGDAVVIDANRDGWLDLYVLDMQGNDEYYENQQGNGFVRRSRDLFAKTPWGAMGAGVFDFDNDGDLDLFITDMHSDMSKDILADLRSEASLNTFYLEEKKKATMQLPESLLKSEGASIYGNAFFRNDGPDRFTEISDEIGVENYWPWGLSVGDLNADGWEDVFIASSMNYPYRYGVNSVLLNVKGEHFADAEFVLRVEPRRYGKTAQPWLLLDCSAESDALVKKVCAGRTGEFVVWGSLGSRSSVIFDLEGDGDLDVVTNEFNDVPQVLVSNLAEKDPPNFLKMKLVGTVSNRQGVGAKVVVTCGERRLLRLYDGKVGYLSQGSPLVYVGLGEAESADSITVEWPSGIIQTIEGPIESGEYLEITEPAKGAPARQAPTPQQ